MGPSRTRWSRSSSQRRLKYLYLLFDPDDEVYTHGKYVFTTEAHPLPLDLSEMAGQGAAASQQSGPFPGMEGIGLRRLEGFGGASEEELLDAADQAANEAFAEAEREREEAADVARSLAQLQGLADPEDSEPALPVAALPEDGGGGSEDGAEPTPVLVGACLLPSQLNREGTYGDGDNRLPAGYTTLPSIEQALANSPRGFGLTPPPEQQQQAQQQQQVPPQPQVPDAVPQQPQQQQQPQQPQQQQVPAQQGGADGGAAAASEGAGEEGDVEGGHDALHTADAELVLRRGALLPILESAIRQPSLLQRHAEHAIEHDALQAFIEDGGEEDDDLHGMLFETLFERRPELTPALHEMRDTLALRRRVTSSRRTEQAAATTTPTPQQQQVTAAAAAVTAAAAASPPQQQRAPTQEEIDAAREFGFELVGATSSSGDTAPATPTTTSSTSVPATPAADESPLDNAGRNAPSGVPQTIEMNGQKVQVTFQDVPEQIQVIQGQGEPQRDTSVQLNPGEKLYHQPGSEVRYRSAGGDERVATQQQIAYAMQQAINQLPEGGGEIHIPAEQVAQFLQQAQAGPGRRRLLAVLLAVVLAVLAQAARQSSFRMALFSRSQATKMRLLLLSPVRSVVSSFTAPKLLLLRRRRWVVVGFLPAFRWLAAVFPAVCHRRFSLDQTVFRCLGQTVLSCLRVFRSLDPTANRL